ncbi:MAG: hypothetical protein M1370_04105 [Bacteroidetes bacterium]|nr:hypothetical protein [Bacteroidota bacterium]MCL5025245.1 hypothetical protein [Chloroflexota bacterium]
MDVEWLILADAAQVVGNKLYLLGGGWETLTVNSGFPVEQQCAVAASFKVPWQETNQRHNVEIEIATEDGSSLAKLQGQFEVGRPPGLRGQEQRVQFAGGFGLRFDAPGTYVIVARVEGQEGGRVHFNVVPGPLLVTSKQQREDES